MMGLRLSVTAWVAAVVVSLAGAQEAAKPPASPVVPAASSRYIEVPAEAGKPETAVRYALVLPDGFDRKNPYPVLLALAPGAEDEAMVESSLATYWEKDAKLRGWVVASPVAPAGKSFATDAADLIPRVIDDVLKRLDIEGGRVHLAGASNGGRAAFHVAVKFPARFASLTVLPGFPPTEEDFAKLGVLRGMRVRLFVGEQDKEWHPRVHGTYERLLSLGINAGVSTIAEQGHVLKVSPDDLFREIEAARPADARDGAMTPEAIQGVRVELLRATNALHAACASGDEKGIYAAMTPEARAFLPGETMSLDRATLTRWATAFTANKKVSILTGRLRERLAHASIGGETAWVEEMVARTDAAPLRITSVLSKVKSGWKVAQWHVSEGPKAPEQAQP